MRLVLVHGINQQNSSDAVLTKDWLGYIDAGLGKPGATAGWDTVVMPFYGDRLAELTHGSQSTAVAQGIIGAPDTNEAAFLAGALSEQAQAANINSRMIAAEERTEVAAAAGVAVAQGFPMNRRINAIVRLLERASPFHGNLVLRLLKQAYVYLKQPGAGGAIDAIVRPAIDAGPAVVVAHSLGTVVTFKLLRQLALEHRPIEVPLFITLGSPLPLMAIQAALGPAFLVPKGVARWVNAVDPNDFIALGRGLDGFAGSIDNILDIRHASKDAHAIEGYLEDRRVAAAIEAALAVTRYLPRQ